MFMTVSFLSLLLGQGPDPRLFVPALDAAQSQQGDLGDPAELSHSCQGWGMVLGGHRTSARGGEWSWGDTEPLPH